MTVNIEKGENIIDILSDGFVTCLKIRKPIAVHWEDCAGSAGKYFSFTDDYKPLVKTFNETLIYGSDDEIINQICEFMKLFGSGCYDIGIIKTYENNYTIHFDYKTQTSPQTFFYSYYNPSGYNMLFTQNYNNININRVKEYENLILNGTKPKLLLFEASFFCEDRGHIDSPMFILDGHHKLLAYHNLNIKPEFVLITKYEGLKNQKVANDNPLFFEYEYFLSNFSKQHIISWNPVILINNNHETINYNKNLDGYLKNTNYITVALLKTFQKAHKSEELKYKVWLDDRLSIIENRDFKNSRLILHYNELTKEHFWNIIEVKSKSDFHEWKKRIFHKLI
jgi:hypothetical protein